MPATTAAPKKAAPKAKPSHGSYQDMISDAIVNLKERNGSSRQALKKYVKANNDLNIQHDKMFDSLFNKALKNGVEKGVFEQPKGPSGGTKLAKKKPAPKAAAEKKDGAAKTEKKPAAKKATTTKKATTAAPKKAAAKTGEKKAPAKKAAASTTKKAAATTKKTADKPEKPETVLTKTKSGRVAKTQKPAAATKKAATTKKAAAPKKAAAKA